MADSDYGKEVDCLGPFAGQMSVTFRTDHAGSFESTRRTVTLTSACSTGGVGYSPELEGSTVTIDVNVLGVGSWSYALFT